MQALRRLAGRNDALEIRTGLTAAESRSVDEADG